MCGLGVNRRLRLPLVYRRTARTALPAAAAVDVETAYQLGMRRLHPECYGSEPSDLSLPADILLREKPDEEEDEEEDKGNVTDDEGDDNKDGRTKATRSDRLPGIVSVGKR